jgi:1-acyl-sn-glycerol-3-phosphate acyltransferase
VADVASGAGAPEAPASRWARRAWTFPLYALLLAASVGLLPLLLAAALAADLARGAGRRVPLVRLVAFAPVFLSAELVGLVAALAAWLAGGPWTGASRERFLAWNFRLQCLWARFLLAAARRLFGLGLEVEGDALAAPGPLVVLARHASLADVLLPAVLLSDRHGLRLRWVMKRELLVDPCLDVVGSRLPNLFVARDAGLGERERAAVARLAGGLGARDGVLIYPEGTRFSAGKQVRALARIGAGPEAARLAGLRALRHLLPPRTGGPLALLAAAPGADVLVVGHVGLEGLATVRELLAGTIVGRRIRVRFWRHRAGDVPRERAAATRWLDARWLELDAWVDARLREGSGAPAAAA